MNVLSFVPNLIDAGPESFSNASKRAERIHRENECSNLLALARLVLDSFLDDAIRGNRMLDAETREIMDLLILLEKILFHGLKTSTFTKFRKSGAELWHFVGRVGTSNRSMDETYKSVSSLSNLSTHISKVRAFWRLAIMQKKFAEYFQAILDSKISHDYYEPWALIRSEKCAFLGGAFLALNVFDCNLLIEFDQLQEQINSFDITPYLRLPTLPGHIPQCSSEFEKTDAASSAAADGDLAVILDQKNYLEERNRQLDESLQQLRRKVESLGESSSLNISNDSSNTVASDDRSLIFTERLRDLEREREILQARLAEKEDAVRISQEQLADTRRFTEDLYEKLKASESKVKRFKQDLQSLKGSHSRELDELNRSMESFQTSALGIADDPMALLRAELTNKTQQYMDSMRILNEKQQELGREREKNAQLQRRCAELESKIEKMAGTEKELAELRDRHFQTTEQLHSCQKALEEFSAALSESKLRMVELKEEIMPLCEAEWVKDSEVANCKMCRIGFSVTQRRHHCRNCGQIYCNACSSCRVKLPSNLNPVRVCLGCYNLLRNRQSSTSISSNFSQ